MTENTYDFSNMTEEKITLPFLEELYYESFMYHPILKGKKTIRAYVLMNAIKSMIIDYYSPKGFNNNLFIDDFEIEEDDDTYYRIKFPNKFFDANLHKSYNENFNYTIEILNDDEYNEKTIETAEETLLYNSPKILYNNIKDDVYKYKIVECFNDKFPEKIYDNDNCPVCLENYENNKHTPYCGHILCGDCYQSIMNSNNLCCPTCRNDWEMIIDECELEVEYEFDDIEELIMNNDEETLKNIIDIPKLVDNLNEYDENWMGYDWINYFGTRFTPKRFNDLIGKNREYYYLVRED